MAGRTTTSTTLHCRLSLYANKHSHRLEKPGCGTPPVRCGGEYCSVGGRQARDCVCVLKNADSDILKTSLLLPRTVTDNCRGRQSNKRGPRANFPHKIPPAKLTISETPPPPPDARRSGLLHWGVSVGLLYCDKLVTRATSWVRPPRWLP